MPGFDTKTSKNTGQKRISRYELLGTNDRITMAVCGATSVHTQFHNVPLKLPPPPGIHNLVDFEHSYCDSTAKK